MLATQQRCCPFLHAAQCGAFRPYQGYTQEAPHLQREVHVDGAVEPPGPTGAYTILLHCLHACLLHKHAHTMSICTELVLLLLDGPFVCTSCNGMHMKGKPLLRKRAQCMHRACKYSLQKLSTKHGVSAVPAVLLTRMLGSPAMPRKLSEAMLSARLPFATTHTPVALQTGHIPFVMLLLLPQERLAMSSANLTWLASYRSMSCASQVYAGACSGTWR